MKIWNWLIGNKKKDLSEAIHKFLNASSASDARRLLERHPELLSEEADSILSALSEDNHSKEIIDLIQNRRKLLALCRKVGVAQAFKEVSNSSSETSEEYLKMILEEVLNLSTSQGMPEKIVRLQHFLSVVQCQSNPELWGVLNMELGSSLLRSSQGNRGDNFEKAIYHYNKALEVFKHQNFPELWAEAQNNLAIAYNDRIWGDRAENIEQAIEHCKQALSVHTPLEFPIQWATTQNNLANAYRSRILGDRSENIERAIEHYNQALQIKTYNDFPVDWALIQNNLAAVYADRVKGDWAENIEQAITYYNQALNIFTYQFLPLEWAMTHNNLANAYNDRIRGDRSKNVECAIEHYNQALKVRTQEDFPVEWAATQNNLGNAYRSRILGDRSENIERAIEHYNQALKVRTQEDLPVEWAMTQNNLANAYNDRIWGDRAENIEKAIEHYNQALEVRTKDDFPVDWAATQNNLANAYRSRILGNRSENIERAIGHYNQALKVYTLENFPVQWAMIQNNLANAYYDRVQGNPAENIEQAIEYYIQALEVRTKDDFPVDWAATQNNLANAYRSHIQGNQADNIEHAIEYYNQALEVYTLQNFPVEWAEVQNNLANAYKERIKGIRADNINQAISHFHSALQIYNLVSMPNDFRRTCRLLGNLYLDIGQWSDALESYKNAIKAGDILYRSGLSEESKTVEIKENASIYRNASFAACRMGLNEEALLILERGKTRLLSEALQLTMRHPEDVPRDEWIKYEMAAKKYCTATKISSHERDYAKREKAVQQAHEELDSVVRVIQRYNPEFQKELDVSDILSIPDNETALLTFCITDKGSIGFVISGLNGIQSVDIPDFKTENLNDLLVKPDGRESTPGGWIGRYLNYLNVLNNCHQSYDTFEASRFHDEAFQSWQKTLIEVLSSIGTELLYPLLEKLPPQIKKLILIPSGGLFLLPLHAVTLLDGHLLCQHYCISYAPSIQLLREMQSKAGVVKGEGFYAVINPQEYSDWVFSVCEGQAISKLFDSSQVNVGETGTKPTVIDKIPGRAYIHFSCYGSYNWNDPSHSGLYLVGGRTLSFADLQSGSVDMSSVRLVTLSASETGITDIMKGSADEFIGLPAGFMLAGVPCVVSSLWSVTDISTALLMERFYSNHIVGGMDIPQALQNAQLWVRDLTFRQVADYVERCHNSRQWEGKSKEFIEQYRERYLRMVEKSPNEKPFQHPYYWAAFTVNGA